MIVLDTNLLPYFSKSKRVLGDRIKGVFESQPDQELRITSVTVFEGIKGAYEYCLEGRKRRRNMIDAFALVVDVVEDLHRWHERILPYDAESEAIFRNFPTLKPPRTTTDSRIAAIALRNGAKLWTQNFNDFKGFPGLVVLDPLSGRSNVAPAGPLA